MKGRRGEEGEEEEEEEEDGRMREGGQERGEHEMRKRKWGLRGTGGERKWGLRGNGRRGNGRRGD